MRLLIVGNLNGHVSSAAKIAISNGARVSYVPTILEGLEILRSGKGADMVIVDINLDILAFLKIINDENISVPIVACGVNIDPDLASTFVRAGAKEYITIPLDPKVIEAIIQSVTFDDKKVIHKDPKTKQILSFAARIALSEASILVTGESGTGKEIIARFIHQESRRKDRSFVSINCAAIPENLLESELFGHEKGAFTGAIARRVGKFEEADGGTLLLDEITEMHPRLQAKLLRAIQEKVIDRVGGTHPVKIDIRIIATSNRNIFNAVKAQEFREDLYFRLNVININMPSLRDRPGDIDVLCDYFIEKYCALNHLAKKKLSPEALKAAYSYDWPGNVRELENSIHRAVLLSHSDLIEPEDIFGINVNPAPKENENIQLMIGKTVSEVERHLICNTIDHCLGNRTHAANILGISISTLRNKLREYNDSGYLVSQ